MHPDVHAETRADELFYIMSATKEVVGRIYLLEPYRSVVAALRGSPLAHLNCWQSTVLLHLCWALAMVQRKFERLPDNRKIYT